MAETKAGSIRRRPTHPGAIVGANLEELNMSVNAAALAIGVTRAALGNLVAQRAAVSPEMALRLGKFFDNGPELWIRMQADVDLWDAKQRIGDQVRAIKKVWDASKIPAAD
jgi:addiction module HigA family antidote